MKNAVPLIGLLLWPALALANVPNGSIATPTLGEAALLSLSLILPSVGVVAVYRRRRR